MANLYYSSYASPLGRIIMVGDQENLLGLWFEEQKYFLAGIDTSNLIEKETSPLRQARLWLDQYFAGQRPNVDVPLAPQGTTFQRIIWDLLLQTPYGTTTTYGELAAQAAKQLGCARMSAQAVGGAVGRNPISLIIPCHRVLSAKSSLTGYAGGIERKKWLLRHEGISFS